MPKMHFWSKKVGDPMLLYCKNCDKIIVDLEFKSCFHSQHKGKGKGKKVKVGFLYCASYAMTGPARFTISEVAVDWQEPMVLQRKLRPSSCTR